MACFVIPTELIIVISLQSVLISTLIIIQRAVVAYKSMGCQSIIIRAVVQQLGGTIIMHLTFSSDDHIITFFQDNSGALLQDEEYIITEDLKSGVVWYIVLIYDGVIIMSCIFFQCNTKMEVSSPTCPEQQSLPENQK